MILLNSFKDIAFEVLPLFCSQFDMFSININYIKKNFTTISQEIKKSSGKILKELYFQVELKISAEIS